MSLRSLDFELAPWVNFMAALIGVTVGQIAQGDVAHRHHQPGAVIRLLPVDVGSYLLDLGQAYRRREI
jgi:hypothetical protein